MSEKDRELLRYSGLSVPQLAALLGRSKQAVYQGVGNPARDYLLANDVLAVVQHAQRRRFRHLENLISFIEKEYDDATNAIVHPVRQTDEVIRLASTESHTILLGINGSDAVLNPRSPFAPVIDNLLSSSVALVIIRAPADWVLDYIKTRVPGTTKASFAISEELKYLPSFCAFVLDGRKFGFFFGRLALEELAAEDIERLWNQLLPTDHRPVVARRA